MSKMTSARIRLTEMEGYYNVLIQQSIEREDPGFWFKLSMEDFDIMDEHVKYIARDAYRMLSMTPDVKGSSIINDATKPDLYIDGLGIVNINIANILKWAEERR